MSSVKNSSDSAKLQYSVVRIVMFGLLYVVVCNGHAGVVRHVELFVMYVLCFFFQAEDGIRDIGVTGVQTCALPICLAPDHPHLGPSLWPAAGGRAAAAPAPRRQAMVRRRGVPLPSGPQALPVPSHR